MSIFQEQGGQSAGMPPLRLAPQPNPFDFGPAADGVDAGLITAFNDAKTAWAAHNKKMMSETIAELDRQIGQVNAWAETLQKALDLAQQIVGMATNNQGHENRMATANELSSALVQTQQVGINLQNVRNAIPFMGNLVGRLLGGIKLA